jgi:hypothetical protein
MPAAGVPWFMTVFGPDSLIVALQSILIHRTKIDLVLRRVRFNPENGPQQHEWETRRAPCATQQKAREAGTSGNYRRRSRIGFRN